MIGVASAEITSECCRDFGMAGVVRGVQHEFAQWSEVALDAIEMTRRRRRRHQFDIVRLGPRTNGWRPVQREVVIHQVDAKVVGITPTDVPVERQHFDRGFRQPVAAEQHVGTHVVGAEEVADSTSLYVGGSSPPGPLALGVAVARVRLKRNRTEFIEAHHHAIRRARAVQRHDACGLFLERWVCTALPGTRALEGDILLAENSPQRLDRDPWHDLAPLQIALQPPQRPVGQWLTDGHRRCQGDGHDALTEGRLKRPRPASADFWVQALKPEVVEGVDHFAHVRLIGAEDQCDLVDGRVHHRGKQDLSALPQRLATRFPQVRQKVHLALLQRANEQGWSGH